MPFRSRMNAVTLERGRPRSGAVITRDITPADLSAGDILFKHASDGWVSQKIRRGQAPHYQDTKKALLEAAAKDDLQNALQGMPTEAEATEITHVAVAAGRDDVLEFDEGGASKWEIIAKSGHGFVRGSMNIPSRLGKTYEVYRCTNPALWEKAVDKATLVWDLTHATHASPDAKRVQGSTPLIASYGLLSMLKTAKGKLKGPEVSLNYFEKTLNEWLVAADRKNSKQSANTNIQFFCSHFVLFCYLWAAAEVQQGGKVRGLDYLLGDKARVSPAELYTRVKSAGQAFFRYHGTLKN